VSKFFARPWYQNGVTTATMRVVPDFALLAAVQPGWPVMLNGQMQSIGGTSGSSPFAMAQLALLSAKERLAGRPQVGFINPWIYQLYQQDPHAFFDVTSGNNDLNGSGAAPPPRASTTPPASASRTSSRSPNTYRHRRRSPPSPPFLSGLGDDNEAKGARLMSWTTCPRRGTRGWARTASRTSCWAKGTGPRL
jgi:hypothetical protein